jgi:hypothetical protein
MGERCACGQLDFSTRSGGVVLEMQFGLELHTLLGCWDADQPLLAPGEEN